MTNPTDVSGLVRWYRADSCRDGSGNPVSADGTAVATLSDLSGGASDATQANANNQPTYKAGILNGQPVVRFDGLNDHLDFSVTADTSKTIFVVGYKRSAPDATARRILGFGSSSHLNASSAASGWAWNNTQTGSSTALGVSATAATVICLRQSTSALLDIYANGTLVATIDPNDEIGTVTTASFGASTFAGSAGDFDWAEFVAYDSVLSDGDRAKVDTYLGARYGITVSDAIASRSYKAGKSGKAH